MHKNISETIEMGAVYQDGLLSSSARTLLRRFQQNPEVDKIIEIVTETSGLLQEILDYATEKYCTAENAPTGYRSDRDMALCGYAYILYDAVTRRMLSYCELEKFLLLISEGNRVDMPRLVGFANLLISEYANEIRESAIVPVGVPVYENISFGNYGLSDASEAAQVASDVSMKTKFAVARNAVRPTFSLC